MYHNGQGVTQDYAKAIEWYKKAAEQRDTAAQKHLAVMYFSGVGVSKDNNILIELLEVISDINKQYEPDNITLLFMAAEKGHVEAVEKLLVAGAKVDIVNKNGETSLWIAAKNSHLCVVEKLLEAGANVNHVVVKGDLFVGTVFSAAKKNPTMLKLIVNKKLITMSNKIFPHMTELQELFIKTIQQETSIEQLIDFIVSNRGYINVTEEDGVTLLMIACEMNSYEAVEKLIVNGAEKDARDTHATALHYAVVCNNTKILTYLLTQGCSLDVPDSTGDYPELWAVEKDNLENLQTIFMLKGSNGICLFDATKIIGRLQGSNGKNLLETAKQYNAKKCLVYLEQVIGDEEISERISKLQLDETPLQPKPMLFSKTLAKTSMDTKEEYEQADDLLTSKLKNLSV